MAVPEEIKRVPRPKSTVVKEAFGRYLVIKRTSRRVPGKRTPRVVDLGTIGEIKDGVYVEIRKTPKKREPKRSVDIKDYGSYAVADKAGRPLFEDLRKAFREGDAEKLYAMALLRSVDFDIRDREIKASYETSYLSEALPGVALSENTVASFLKAVGAEYSRIRAFLTDRAKGFAGRTQVIDGTLKGNNSSVNDFSEFSRKGRVKGSKDISILYSYDLESREPVLMKVYSGNVIDKRSLADFVGTFKPGRSIVVMDKGFGSRSNLKALEALEGLTYVIPLARSSRLLSENGMYDGISTPLGGKDEQVMCKSVDLEGGGRLYSYRDPRVAAEEEVGYMKRKGESLDAGEYEMARKRFGVISLVSNGRLTCEEVYEAYMGRWEIETMFSMMKDVVGLDTVGVHSDYSVIASEFVNYLAVIISQRVKRLFRETALRERRGKPVRVADEYSYRQAMKLMSKIKKIRLPGGGWETNYPANCKYIQELGESLGV